MLLKLLISGWLISGWLYLNHFGPLYQTLYWGRIYMAEPGYTYYSVLIVLCLHFLSIPLNPY